MFLNAKYICLNLFLLLFYLYLCRICGFKVNTRICGLSSPKTVTNHSALRPPLLSVLLSFTGMPLWHTSCLFLIRQLTSAT